MTREQLEISRQYLNSIDPKRDISCIVDRKIKKQTYDLAVIMPCYNVEKYVEEAVDSILHQETNFKVELIIVNDGSTDSTGEIVNHYGDLDDVLVIHQENKGLSAARNTGLFYADARYLCFIDSDDYMTDGALDLLLDVAFENKADIVQGIMNLEKRVLLAKSKKWIKQKWLGSLGERCLRHSFLIIWLFRKDICLRME